MRKMLGLPDPKGRHLEAVLEQPVRHKLERTSFLPGRLVFAGSEVRATPIPTCGSADLAAHSRADGLLILAAERERFSSGEKIPVLLLE
jgi:molybdopterin biosynthesis enzyme